MHRSEVEMLPEALRAWRSERGWSQKELGVRADVSGTLIALIETGERQPGIRNALAIADAIGVDLRAIANVYVEIERIVEVDEPARNISRRRADVRGAVAEGRVPNYSVGSRRSRTPELVR